MRVLAAPDKFRGSLTALEVANAIETAVNRCGETCVCVPMADGGEGTLDVLGGPNRETTVTGPLGDPVKAEWRIARKTAVIEMARASGLSLTGGPKTNNPLEATTKGTGELIRCAMEQGAKRIIIGLGGSATTDGGLGALRAMGPLARYKGIELIAVCDVQTNFLSAADSFGIQKGATPGELKFLNQRLQRITQVYEDEFGICEVFSTIGKAGGNAAAQSEAVSRLISLALRSGVDPQEVISELKGISGPTPVWENGELILSTPDAIGKAIERHVQRGIGVFNGAHTPQIEEKKTEKSNLVPPNGNGVDTSIKNAVTCPDCGAAV